MEAVSGDRDLMKEALQEVQEGEMCELFVFQGMQFRKSRGQV
jgi:hypothetical protein